MTDATPGMATGSDAGAPGEHLPPAPLQPEEQQLLEELRGDADELPPASPEVIRAVEDDAPLAVPDPGTGSPGESDSPEFVEP